MIDKNVDKLYRHFLSTFSKKGKIVFEFIKNDYKHFPEKQTFYTKKVYSKQTRAMKVKSLFSKSNRTQIIRAIEKMELTTSAEVRVHIENNCNHNILDRASNIFNQLKMTDIKLRNGVLIYLAIEDRQFAILGDVGVNAKVSPDLWDDIKSLMLKEFKKNQFTEGIIKGIFFIGETLKEHFPHQPDNINELSNDISFGKD